MLSTKMIGTRIAEARKKSKLSQAQLAEQLFISQQAVGKWERGESMPDLITLNRLAGILGVDLNYFSENFQAASSEKPGGEPLQQAPVAGKERQKRSWDMSRENLQGVDFSGLKNLHEKFTSSNVQRCLFIASDMSGLLLKSNNVESCDFSGSDMSNSQIQSSNLANNAFRDCCLKETEFLESHLQSNDLSRADLTGATFRSGGFEKNTLTDVIWKNTSFQTTYLADLVFEGTLEDCYFENCSFTRVKFRNATLLNTFFKHNKRLKRIQFVDCKADKMTYAFLKSGQAEMSGVTLVE